MLTSKRIITLFAAPGRSKEIGRDQGDEVVSFPDRVLRRLNKAPSPVFPGFPVEYRMASGPKPLVYDGGWLDILPGVAQEDPRHLAPSRPSRGPRMKADGGPKLAEAAPSGTPPPGRLTPNSGDTVRYAATAPPIS